MITIKLSDIEYHESVSAAIDAVCEKSDRVASGTIGSSFSTSGPGYGWSIQHEAEDYARRALDDEYGAEGYIDSSDGRMATIEDGEVVWTDETVVDVEDDDEEVSKKTMRLLEEAVESGHVTSDISTRCTCSSCGCDELATHYDSDAGCRFCAECTNYVCDKGGEVTT